MYTRINQLKILFQCQYSWDKTFCLTVKRFLLTVKRFWLFSAETRIKRQATRHDYLPTAWLVDDGDKWSEIVCSEEKKYFVLDRLEQQAGQKSLVPARGDLQTNQRRTPFICTPWVPICRSFNSQQGPPHSNLSGFTKQQLAAYLSTAKFDILPEPPVLVRFGLEGGVALYLLSVPTGT